jgi:2-polyprenyl-6-methoxyphenol hydroxylase-like FAD-dependent oxidoreductase
MNPSAGRPIPAHVDRREPAAGEHRVDGIVLGGGPAGSATALVLARAGYSVTVLERSRYDGFRVGETLPPEVRCPLIELGAWEQFRAEDHLESPGIAAAWGGPEPIGNDFLVNPYGPGWHVDRCRFDAMLARAAESSGVDVVRGARPTACVPDLSGGWHREAQVDGVPRAWRAAVLVDATGRTPSPARRCGGHRIVCDRLVGLVRLIPSAASGPAADRRTLVEALEHGWWYTAPLPGGRHIAIFLTDADLLPTGRSEWGPFWRQQLQRAPHTSARLGTNSPDSRTWIVPACSSRLECIAGAAGRGGRRGGVRPALVAGHHLGPPVGPGRRPGPRRPSPGRSPGARRVCPMGRK